MKAIVCALALVGLMNIPMGPLASVGVGVAELDAQGRRNQRRAVPYQGNSRGYQGPAFHAGYKDGYDKGLEDADDRDRYHPTRHGRYRSADHGYEREYGPKGRYRVDYRQGFLAGYDAGYRDFRGYRDHRGRRRSGWSFGFNLVFP
jgi:hypothetical protein